MDIKELQQEAIDKCWKSATHTHYNIMKEMIEKAYHEGRKQGQREMSQVARRGISELIPSELDY